MDQKQTSIHITLQIVINLIMFLFHLSISEIHLPQILIQLKRSHAQQIESFYITLTYLLSILWYLLLYLGIFLTLYLLLSQNEQSRHYTAIIIICSLIYLSYIGMTVQRSEERVYLQNLLGGQLFEIQYENNRSKKGMFNMVAQCYHIVKRQIIKPAKNKHSKRQVQTIQQKIITYTANQSFSPKTINDLSGSADRIRASTNIIFVQFKVDYTFKDQASRQIFFKEFDRFKNKNKRDVHQRYEYNYEVNNFKHKLSFYAGTLPCNLKIWYNIFLLTGLLWPFCIWLQFKIQRCQINFLHQIKL